MWIKYSEKYEAIINKKKESHKVRLTTHVQGTLKTNVLNDCIKKGMIECEIVKAILDLHYQLMQKHNCQELDFEQIKKKLL